MIVVGVHVAAASLMIAKARGIIDVDHQRNLVAVIGTVIDGAAIVKHLACSASTSIEVVDMRASLAHCQLVQRHALMSLTIGTNGRLLVTSLRGTGAAGIDLLNKEMTVPGVLVLQIGVSLEIHPNTELLVFSQRIGN